MLTLAKHIPDHAIFTAALVYHSSRTQQQSASGYTHDHMNDWKPGRGIELQNLYGETKVALPSLLQYISLLLFSFVEESGKVKRRGGEEVPRRSDKSTAHTKPEVARRTIRCIPPPAHTDAQCPRECADFADEAGPPQSLDSTDKTARSGAAQGLQRPSSAGTLRRSRGRCPCRPRHGCVSMLPKRAAWCRSRGNPRSGTMPRAERLFFHAANAVKSGPQW